MCLHSGYVQGMSDLLSPILEVMGSEVDAFWCFVGFMNIVVSTRECTLTSYISHDQLYLLALLLILPDMEVIEP